MENSPCRRCATSRSPRPTGTTDVKRSATLDPNLAKHPNGGVPLSAEDQRALVAFLKTLTDAPFLVQAAAGAAKK